MIFTWNVEKHGSSSLCIQGSTIARVSDYLLADEGFRKVVNLRCDVCMPTRRQAMSDRHSDQLNLLFVQYLREHHKQCATPEP